MDRERTQKTFIAMVVNRIKNQNSVKSRVPTLLLSLSVNSLSLPPTFLCIYWASGVFLSLSLMARLSLTRSLALWLTVRKAWIMSASARMDRPSCAAGLFISRTYLNVPLLVPGGKNGMKWVCERGGGETKKRGKEKRERQTVLHM